MTGGVLSTNSSVTVNDPLVFWSELFVALQWTVVVPTGNVSPDLGSHETGISPSALAPLGVADVVGDSCRRGADAHRWHAFLAVAADPRVRLGDEGRDPVWLSVAEALAILHLLAEGGRV